MSSIGDLSMVLQAAYDCEVNVKIQTFWDGGYEIYVGGSPMDDFKSASAYAHCDLASDIASTLALVLFSNFPEVLEKRARSIHEQRSRDIDTERLSALYSNGGME